MNRGKPLPCIDPDCGVHGRGTDPVAREVICARQILRMYDRPGVIVLLDRQPVESRELGEERSVIGLSSASAESPGGIQPGRSCTIGVETDRHVRSFRLERLVISAAGTAGGAADWVVNDIVLGERSQIAPHRDLPGAIFGAEVLGTLRAFDRISGDAPIQVTVTYVGANPSGVPFYASIVGATTYR